MQVRNYAAPICLGIYGAVTVGSSFLWNSAVASLKTFGTSCPHDDYFHGQYSSSACAALANSVYAFNISGFVLKVLGFAAVGYVIYDIRQRNITPINPGEQDALVQRGDR